MFFLQGPKTLFQVALAIIKLNGEELLQTEDDGSFISIIKDYFQTLDQSAHPNSPNEKYRSITKFQELLVTAFKEFLVVDEDLINKHRSKHRDTIFSNILTFVKRTELRNLPKTSFTQEALLILYERFYAVVESYNVTMASGSSLMDFKLFTKFMSEICDWCNMDSEEEINSAIEISFLKRLFHHWDSEQQGAITLADLVVGLNKLTASDLMESIANFFELYDNKGNGKIDREGILQMSEDLLYLTTPWKEALLLDLITESAIEKIIADQIIKQKSTEVSPSSSSSEIILPSEIDIDDNEKQKLINLQVERYLSGASTFIQRAFEYAQPIEEEVLIAELAIDNKISHNAALDPNSPVYLNLPTFRMVVLADETYELLFSRTLRHSIRVAKPLDQKFNTIRNLRDMFDGLLADGRKVATQVRKRMDSAATNANNNIFNANHKDGKEHSDNASMKSSKKDEEDDADDDFGVIAIDDSDKDLLLGAEAQVLIDPMKQSKPARDEELSRFHKAEAEAKGNGEKLTNNINLIEFENDH